MIRHGDLHPADHAARITLRDQFTQARRDRGLSQRDLARHLSIGQAALAGTERSRSANMHADTAQHRARVLAHRLTFAVDGFMVPPCPTTATLHQLAADAATDTAEDAHHLAATVAHLHTIRRWTGMDCRALARRIAVYDDAVSRFELHTRIPLLGTMQRYARGLGGVLRFDLIPVQIPTLESAAT
jgi:transcriptional regulator with XRE-family HTH domain